MDDLRLGHIENMPKNLMGPSPTYANFRFKISEHNETHSGIYIRYILSILVTKLINNDQVFNCMLWKNPSLSWVGGTAELSLVTIKILRREHKLIHR